MGVSGLSLYSLLRRNGLGETLSVYIEGDGAAWANAFQPPKNPTPSRSLPLLLAHADDAATVAYLGRPCQYLDDQRRSACPVSYWAERRFSPEVLEAMNDAVSQLKNMTGSSRIRLVGYSGGGVVAALLATRRSDVAQLVTIAAPLDLSGWVAEHDLSPLVGSLDPMQENSPKLSVIAIHFVGADDEVVPANVVRRYVARHGGKMVVVADYNHDCCWEEGWRERLRDTLELLEKTR